MLILMTVVLSGTIPTTLLMLTTEMQMLKVQMLCMERMFLVLSGQFVGMILVEMALLKMLKSWY